MIEVIKDAKKTFEQINDTRDFHVLLVERMFGNAGLIVEEIDVDRYGFESKVIARSPVTENKLEFFVECYGVRKYLPSSYSFLLKTIADKESEYELNQYLLYEEFEQKVKPYISMSVKEAENEKNRKNILVNQYIELFEKELNGKEGYEKSKDETFPNDVILKVPGFIEVHRNMGNSFIMYLGEDKNSYHFIFNEKFEEKEQEWKNILSLIDKMNEKKFIGLDGQENFYQVYKYIKEHARSFEFDVYYHLQGLKSGTNIYKLKDVVFSSRKGSGEKTVQMNISTKQNDIDIEIDILGVKHHSVITQNELLKNLEEIIGLLK